MQIKSTDKRIRVIYIAGYGHSGSTILETLLCCSEEVIGLGELVGIPRELNASFTKTFMKENPFCANIFERIKKKLEDRGESLQSITELNSFENPLRVKSKPQKDRYQNYWKTFLESATDSRELSSATFVDSSKTSFIHAMRPYQLDEIDGIDVAMVHIVRHPKAILFRLKGKAVLLSDRNEPKWISEIIQVCKTTLNWTFSNIWPAMLSHKLNNYVRISFEELCEYPVESLKKIEESCKIDLSETIHRVKNNQPLPPTCGIAGNIPVKKKEKELRFQPSKKSIPKTGLFISLLSVLLLPVYKFLTR